MSNKIIEMKNIEMTYNINKANSIKYFKHILAESLTHDF